MQKGRTCGSLATVIGIATLVACGGGVANVERLKGPDVAPSAGGLFDAGVPTTTTTVLLGDGGELQGTKLSSSSVLTLDTSPKPDAGSAGASRGRSDAPGRRPADLMTIIGTHRDEARACYDAALKGHPGIEGNLDIKFTIDPKGVVVDGAADDGKSDIHEPGVVLCIVNVLKKIKFAEHPKGFETKAHYPFNFHPHAAPKM